jgi:uncharacterized protein with PQ loop repeat
MESGSIGFLATMASLIILFVGFPSQIYENYKRKSCEGLSLPLVFSVSLSYSLWSLYGWMKPDKFLICAQTPGVVFGLILIFQLFYYRKKEV